MTECINLSILVSTISRVWECLSFPGQPAINTTGCLQVEAYLAVHVLPKLQLFSQRLAAILQVDPHQCLSFQLSLGYGATVFCLDTAQGRKSESTEQKAGVLLGVTVIDNKPDQF